MILDPPRTLLLKLIADYETDLASVSKALGRNHAYLQQYVKRGTPRELPEEVRERLGDRFDVPPDSFRLHKARVTPLFPAGTQQAATPPRLRVDTVTIVELDVRAGNALAGPIHEGQDLSYDHESVVGEWQIPSVVLRAHVPAPASQIRIIQAVGTSNVPHILPGDRLMIDLSQTEIGMGGWFAIWDGSGIIIKQLEIIPYSEPRRVRMWSGNPEWESREYPLEQVVIRGRMVGKWLWT
ncbi:MAG: S24 family peptidase [Aliidongia sp.]